MKAIEVHRTRAFIVILLLLTAALVYADAQRSAAVPVPSTVDRTPAASAAEAAIATTNLAARLETGLGDDFGGLWFDPEAAQLHVGVTSAASRLAAESIAAEVGLADTLVETPVDSTWAELDAAQERWDRRLLDLLERGEAATALVAERNAVQLELGSAVPSARRAALKSDAAAASIEVRIAVAPYPRIQVEPNARCNKFALDKAFCNPTFVGGVTIRAKENEGERQRCTAGPTVTWKGTGVAEATETYVLTAGHCIAKATIGKKWDAYNQAEEEKEVGSPTQFLFNETDVGMIQVTTTYWAKANDFVPVVPTIAPWDKEAPEPFAVVAQSNPVEKTKSCMAGQSTGISCGEIITTDQTVELEGKTVKNLIEVKNANSALGDSGGPWFSEAKFEEATPTGYVEGTHVGEKGATGNPVFQSLKTSFEKLKNEKGIDLELLTTANEKRHPFKFATEAAPTVLTGSQHSATKTTFSFSAGVVSCAGVTYTGELTVTGTIEMNLTPAYAGCTLGGNPVTVDVNSCFYKFTPQAKTSGNFEGKVDILCPAGKKIEFTAMGCTITVGPQAERMALTYTNLGAGATREITIDLNLVALAYEEHSVGPPNCANNTVPKVTGTSAGSLLVTGETAAKAHRGIWVE